MRGSNQYRARGQTLTPSLPAGANGLLSQARGAGPRGQSWRRSLDTDSDDHQLLATLAGDQTSSTTRMAVAANPHTDPATLRQLARDDNQMVRLEVADNPHTPPETLVEMLHREQVGDTDSCVTEAIASNPNLPAATLAMWQLAH